MSTGTKIVKSGGETPTAIELDVSQVGHYLSEDWIFIRLFQQFSELEGNAQFKGQLRELYITGAKVRRIIFEFSKENLFSLFQKIELGDGRSALIIYIPVPKVKNFQRVHSLLVSELEKKYNQTVVLLGQVKSIFSSH